ncbi:MAG: amino acid adenylation domain-containing protein [Candidatus Omnitrophota bacterium]
MDIFKKSDARNIEDITALTPLQEGILFHYLKEPQSDSYFEQLSLTISGTIDARTFEQAWNSVIAANEMLRTVFRWEKLEKPTQLVLKQHKLQFLFHDLSEIEQNAKHSLLSQLKNNDRETRFDLKEVPFRVTLCKIETEKYEMIISNHHIIYDGWSNGIILSEFFNAYNRLIHNEPLKPVLKPPFKEFLKWTQNLDKKKQEHFWSKYLAEFENPTELVIKKRKTGKTSGTKTCSFILEEDVKHQLDAFTVRNRVTWAAVFYTAWGLLLQRYCNSDDVVFGTTVSGRSAGIKGINDMVGLFINTIPLRVNTHPDEKRIDAVFRIDDALRAREDFEHTPLVDIRGYTELNSEVPLFDTLMVIENYPLDHHLLPSDSSLSIDSFAMVEATHYGLTLSVMLWDQIDVRFTAKDSLADEEAIKYLSGHFKSMIHEIIENAEQRISDIDMLSTEEKQRLLFDFNNTVTDYRKDQTIHELFEEQVERSPDRIALIGATSVGALREAPLKMPNWAIRESPLQISYRELNRQSDQLAHELIKKGVQTDTIVGIKMERSIEMIIAILGILKSGGAYLPIDPSYPPERIDYMLKDCGLLLATEDTEVTELIGKNFRFFLPIGFLLPKENENKFKAGIKSVNNNLKSVNNQYTNKQYSVNDNLKLVNNKYSTNQYSVNDNQYFPSLPSVSSVTSVAKIPNLAYVIYTSGSTGRPKGVMIAHQAVHNFMEGISQLIAFKPGKVMLALTTITFDIFGLETLLPLCRGLKVVMANEAAQQDMHRLEGLMIRHCIDMMQATPTRIQLFVEDRRKNPCLENLKEIMIGGETFPALLLTRLKALTRAKIYNMYGPTETTIWSTVKDLTETDEMTKITIGSPIANTQIYILNKYFHIQPLGVAGELTIAGDGIARGYLNNPELTFEKFCLRRPTFLKKGGTKNFWYGFGVWCGDGVGYRTGDLARWLGDGNIEFLGRIDHQVKVRGIRIELGEIENHLLSHPDVKETVVVLRENLIAYVVSNKKISASGLRHFLSGKLPDAMIPASVIQIEKIPLTSSGKINRNALPDPGMNIKNIINNIGESYIAPESKTEKKLAKIWSEVLGMNPENVSVHSNFFHLGGHSLKAMMLVSRINRDLNANVTLRDVFKYPTIRQLGQSINGSNVSQFASINKAEEKEYYVLSSSQKRMYYLHRMDEQGVGYNMSFFAILDGAIDKEKFEDTFRRVIRRHESLRTSFHLINNEPVQRIQHTVEFEIDYVLSKPKTKVFGPTFFQKGGPPEAMIKSFIRSFELSHAPLIRVALLKETDKTHLFMVDMHHIISDGTSVNILINDFIALYKGDELTEPAIRYNDFAEWQNTDAYRKWLKPQEDFWLNEFEGDIPVLELPIDDVRPSIQRFEGNRIDFEVSAEVTEKVKKLALETDTTLYMVLLALYHIFLSNLSGREDMVIGTPAAGRRHTDLEKIIGMFVNTLPLRMDSAGELSFVGFLHEVKEKTLQAFENQDYPYDELIEHLNLNRDAGRNPLFDTMFALQNMDMAAIEIPGLKLSPCQYENNVAKFDLTLSGMERENNLLLTFEYSTALFKRETIERFTVYFKNIIDEVIENKNKNKRISEFEILTEDETHRLLVEFNNTKADYPTDKTIHEWFEGQVERTPDRIALIGSASVGALREAPPLQISYRELNQRSNVLAHELIEKGVQPDTIVGIKMERSIEMIIAILGILKAGGAYLPIDPSCPQERIDYMLKDCGLLLATEDTEFTELIGKNFRFFLSIGFLLPMKENENKFKTGIKSVNNNLKSVYTNEQYSVNDNQYFPFFPSVSSVTSVAKISNLAYVIYTSGSTGKPKGVLAMHSNVMNFVRSLDFIGITPGDRILQLSNYAFDGSIFDIYAALLNGAALVMIRKEEILDVDRLAETIKREQVTVFLATTALFNTLVDLRIDCFKYIRKVVFGGERVSVGHCRHALEYLGNNRIIHMYGPTETTVYASYYAINTVANQAVTVPIGKPPCNVVIYLLNRYLKPVPVGVSGEMYIGGAGTTRGYLNNPELTFEKFLNLFNTKSFGKSRNPFSKGFLAAGGIPYTLYKTGDCARWLVDGNIEFLGRIDNQVKIRGFRIELGEIEFKLSRHPEISNAVVIVNEDDFGNKNICAYIVTRRACTASELREYLSGELPDYMIPAYIINVEKFPVTANGKIDVKMLPKPQEIDAGNQSHGVPPRNPVEKTLVETWENVLGRNPIGIRENFFHLGGDSIKAIRILSQINSAGYKLEMKHLFQYPVIADLAPHVTRAKRVPDQSPITGIIPLTPIQTMFFHSFLNRHHDHHDHHYNHFNQAVMFYSKNRLDKSILEKIFTTIQAHHDALRMTYQVHRETGKVIQCGHGTDYPFSFEETDIQDMDHLQTEINRIQSSINLETGPLMKLGLFHLNDGDRLLIVIHHLAIDGVSWRILFEDIETLYGQYQRGNPPILPPKTDSFKRWSEQLSVHANTRTFLKEKTYWAELESQPISGTGIKKDVENSENLIRDTRDVSFDLTEEETERLLTKVNEAFNTEMNDILLTALGMGIRKTFGEKHKKHILIALEGHGREDMGGDLDISRTVGWFTGIYPVRFDMSYADDTDDPSRQIKEIKETCRRIPRKGIGYGILRYLTDDENKKEIDFRLKPPISFNYLGQFDADIRQLSFVEIAKESVGHTRNLDGHREYLIDVLGMIVNHRLTVTISYNETHFKSETAAALADTFQADLKKLIAFCGAKQNTEPTPSDFISAGSSMLLIESLDRLIKWYPGLKDMYPLTTMQEGMLFHAAMDETARSNISYVSYVSYIQQVSYRVKHIQKQPLDIGMMEKSLNALFARHDILRTVFVYKHIERPMQLVLNEKTIDFTYRDIRQRNNQESIANITKFISEIKETDRNRPFDLGSDALLRLSIIRVNDTEYEFIWSFHHIIMDGWCLGILNNEFFEIYQGYIENRPCRLGETKPYRMYMQWLNAQDNEEAVRYWENYLDAFEEQTGIPKPTIIHENKTYKNETLLVRLEKEKTARLNRLASGCQVTVNIVLLVIWGMLLGKYHNKQDVLFGTVVSGRPHELEGVETMVGLFINTIPVRIRLTRGMTLNTLLRHTQEEAVAGEPYHYHPLSELQGLSSLKQNLIDHLFVFENYPLAEALPFTDVDVFEQTHYDFNLIFTLSDRLTVKFQYNGNEYNREYVERIAGHFVLAIDWVLDNEDRDIDALCLLSTEEKNKILHEFNNTKADYPKDKTIHQLFEDQVKRGGDRIAIIGLSCRVGADPCVCPQLSYKELNVWSDVLAHELTEKGVQPDTIVAIKMERSIEMIIAILGILKAGGAYLPIDPDYPQERIDFMLKDSGATICISSSMFPFPQTKRFCPAFFKKRAAGGTNLLYIIYTSGSTGKPKGVMLEHRNLVNLMLFEFRYTNIDCSRILQFTSLSFDVSFQEIFSALLSGGQIVVIDKETRADIPRLFRFIERNDIKWACFPISLLKVIFNEEEYMRRMPACLTHIQAAGERLVIGDHFRNYIREKKLFLHNHYGPSETHAVTTLTIDPESDIPEFPSIGKPVMNTIIHILDSGGQLLPIGIAGELCIGGDQVGRGYLNNPELTFEKFCLRRPTFLKKGGAKNFWFERFYKTGDLSRWLVDGNIEFLGRIDHQVKIRGFRVETEEVEKRLVSYPGVKQCVVTARTDDNGDKYLCAYLVSDDEWGISDYRRKLSGELPGYMIPSYFVLLDRLPLTSGGKIDRRALPEPGRTDQGETDAFHKLHGEIEERLASIWSGVLEIEMSRIDANSDFFMLGGHSLKAMIMIARIHNAFDIELPVAEIFKTPTLRGLATRIKELKRETKANESGVPVYEPVFPAEEKDYYRLSYAQKRMYILQQMDEQGTGYNIPFAFILDGELDKERMEETFKKLIHRHESLRTSFQMINGDPVQRIHERVEFKIEFIKKELIKHPRPQHPEPKVFGPTFFQKGGPPEAMIKTFIRSFELTQAPLIRVGVLKESDSKHLLIVDMHHIISDGVSMNILITDFMALYKGQELDEPGIRYKDFSEWQNRDRQQRSIKQQEAFWLNEFADEIPVLALPIDHERPLVQCFEGRSIDVEIDGEMTAALKILALEAGATLYMVLLAIYHVFLSKLSFNGEKEDIIVGTPVAGRRHSDLEKIIGMFVNTLALRNQPMGEKTFSGFLLEVKENTLHAFENQDYPYEALVERLNLNRDAGRNPLFDTMFALQNMPVTEIVIPGLKLSPYQYENNISKFDLSFTGMEREDKLTFTCEYSTTLFNEETIKRLIAYFQNILNQVIEDKNKRIRDMEIITQEEKNTLVFDFNNTAADYPKNKAIHEFFEEQAEKIPDCIASGGQGAFLKNRPLDPQKTFCYLTYRELNDRANALAHELIETGVQSDTIVAIKMERSLEMLIGILGILKAGGAYLPIDPSYPSERIDYMLKDCGLLLATEDTEVTEWIGKNFRFFLPIGFVLPMKEKEEKFKTRIKSVNNNLKSVNNQYTNKQYSVNDNLKSINNQYSINDNQSFPFLPSVSSVTSVAKTSNLAYVIYTSGTTGKPKGVMVTHRALVNRMHWVMQKYRLNFEDVVLQKTSCTFDVSVCELFRWIMPGARLCMLPADAEKDPLAILSFIETHGITNLDFVPSMFRVFLDCVDEKTATRVFRRLRWVFIGAEAVSRAIVDAFHQKIGRWCGARLMNLYGPTEATIDVTYFDCSAEKSTGMVPIGKPMANIRIWILDKAGYLQPIRVTGELCISGDALARGYLNHPELTFKTFCLRRPTFLKKGGTKNFWFERFYKTGDLSRWLVDGNIEFLGRIDHQVKVRGFRIELGEIENRLLLYPGIKHAAVACKSDPYADNMLCAYIVGDHPIPVSELKEFLLKYLPDYMIPPYMTQIDNLPLTPNGKLDRNALPDPEIKPGHIYAAPQDAIEDTLVDIWSDVLSVEKKQIGIDTNFFDLGGHSLKAIALTSRVHHTFNVRLPLTEVFNHPVIRRLAAYIREFSHAGFDEYDEYDEYNNYNIYMEIELAEQKEYYNLSSAQSRLFVLQQMDTESTAYNMPLFLELEEEPDKEKLENAFNRLIERHETLRTSFSNINGKTVQVIHEPMKLNIAYDEWDQNENSENDEIDLTERFVKPFDLGKSPLIRVGVAVSKSIPCKRRILMVDMHHIISDGLSHDILEEEFFNLYEGKPLPALTRQYKDYTEWQESPRYRAALEKQEQYWLSQLNDGGPVLNMPYDFARPDVLRFEGRSLSFEIAPDQTARIKTLVEQNQVTLNIYLLAVYNVLLSVYTGQDDILVGIVISGRRHMDLQNIVGFFVNMLPIRNHPSGNKPFVEFLNDVKETVVAGYENQDYPFERMVHRLGITREPGRHPLIDIVFAFQEKKDTPPKMRLFHQDHSARHPYRPYHVSHFDLMVHATDRGERINLTIEYSNLLFKQRTIEMFAECYIHILEQLAANNEMKLAQIEFNHQFRTSEFDADHLENTDFDF